MAETLRPCPFCGGEAAIQRFSSKNLPFRIICSCGAEIRGGKGESVSDGVERWNRRAELTCRNVYDERRHEMERCINGFECSECGEVVEDFEGYAVKGDFLHCPRCGARVVTN